MAKSDQRGPICLGPGDPGAPRSVLMGPDLNKAQETGHVHWARNVPCMGLAAMESLKGEFGLRASATTTPGLLRVMFVAMANRKIRVQRRLLGLGAQPPPQRRR